MAWFKRKQQQEEPAAKPEAISIQYDRDSVVVEATDIDAALSVLQFWEEAHGQKPDSGVSRRVGFSTDHMSDVGSDTERAPQPDDRVCDDPDCEECE